MTSQQQARKHLESLAAAVVKPVVEPVVMGVDGVVDAHQVRLPCQSAIRRVPAGCAFGVDGDDNGANSSHGLQILSCLHDFVDAAGLSRQPFVTWQNAC